MRYERTTDIDRTMIVKYKCMMLILYISRATSPELRSLLYFSSTQTTLRFGNIRAKHSHLD